MSEVCVRVAARVRPLLPAELHPGHRQCVSVLPGTQQVLLGTDRLFNFDHAFGQTATQRDVYCACVQPLVLSVLEGFNATVFCYGQTGSGKSYTLWGRRDTDDVPDEDGGVLAQVVQDLFSLLEEKRSAGDDMRVTVSYIELYMEELRDLLDLPHIDNKGLQIIEIGGNTVVMGAKEVAVSSVEELLSIVDTGRVLSQTGSTGMNQKSSRSHTILTLHVHNAIGSSSKLRLVDLAGMERVARTGNTGTRLKESTHINKGLLALGNVMRALSGRHGKGGGGAHVQYRSSKLTRLLRDSLGGTAHTLMVACVSPSHRYVTDTLNVLRFASKARKIRNVPTATRVPTELTITVETWQDREAEVAEMERELHALREKLRDQEEQGGGSKEAHYRVLIQQAADLLDYIADSAPPTVIQTLREWKHRVRAISHTEEEDDDDDDEGDDHHFDDDSLTCQHQANVLQLREELTGYQKSFNVQKQLLEQKEAELQRLQKEKEELGQASEKVGTLICRQPVLQVVCLRDLERNLELGCEKKQLRVEELEGKVKEMEVSMQRLALEADERIQILLEKHKDYQNTTNNKLHHLEMDLFFYKKSSHHIKKRLNEILGDSRMFLSELTQRTTRSADESIMCGANASLRSQQVIFVPTKKRSVVNHQRSL